MADPDRVKIPEPSNGMDLDILYPLVAGGMRKKTRGQQFEKVQKVGWRQDPVGVDIEAPIRIWLQIGATRVPALVDSGASLSVISRLMVTRFGLKVGPIKEPRTAKTATGEVVQVTEAVRLDVQLGSIWFPLRLFVLDVGFDIILGTPFFKAFQPKFDFEERTVTLSVPVKKGEQPSGETGELETFPDPDTVWILTSGDRKERHHN